MALLDIIKKDSVDRSVNLRIIDSADGTPETGVAFDTGGIDLWYRREGAAKTSITEATLAALTTAHTDGGFLHVSDGEYRLDLPDAAFATGANYVDIGGTVSGMVVIGGRVRLVDYDPEAGAWLQPTTSGRTLDVTATGAAGIDWGNVENQTTAVSLTLTSIANVTLVDEVSHVDTAGIDAASFAADAITATAIAADAIGSSELAATAITEIQSGLSTLTAANVWEALTSGFNVSGSIGKLFVDNLDVVLSTRLSGSAFDTKIPTAFTFTSGNVHANAAMISGDSTAADNAELAFDGTGFGFTGCTMPTTTTVTNIVTANVTQISGDSTAADNAELAFDGTGYGFTGCTIPTVTTLTNKTGFALSSAGIGEIYDLADGIEVGLTPRNAFKLIAGSTAGLLSGAGTATNVIRNAVADSKDRLTVTCDADGNRTAITYDLT